HSRQVNRAEAALFPNWLAYLLAQWRTRGRHTHASWRISQSLGVKCPDIACARPRQRLRVLCPLADTLKNSLHFAVLQDNVDTAVLVACKHKAVAFFN